MPYFRHDTIAQAATPPGDAIAAVLRVSGPEAFRVVASCLEEPAPAPAFPPPRGLVPARLTIPLAVYGPHGRRRARRVCPVQCLFMPAPASYTREDVAEIILPGAAPLVRAALSALVEAGARAAEPGEFTFRAFRNGRLELSQAEAVEEVVAASGAAERRAALARLGDGDAGKIRRWRDRALDVAARIEAILDFSDTEPDLAAAADIESLAAELTGQGIHLRDAAAPAPAAADAPRVALVGLANAGKSSLWNALLEREDALVSSRASTTRDRLERTVCWHGVRLTILDTPGYHPDGDGAGGAAADRAWRGLGGEDLAVWVLDGSRPFGPAERSFAERLSAAILVLNKADLPAALGEEEAAAEAARAGVAVRQVVRTSARDGRGVAALGRLLAREARAGLRHGLWNRREAGELARALGHCRAAAAELAGPGRWELAAEELRQAVSSFSLAMGDGYAEEALARIFSTFCIGK